MSHQKKHAEYYLNPGDLLFSRNPCLARTVLGSCVSVVFYDEFQKIGGLCHYLLPTSPEGIRSTKYADMALPYLLSKFLSAGTEKKHLSAWVLGGSLMLDSQEIFFVGDRNIDFALQFLEERRIKVKFQKTGGSVARRVIFHTHSGELEVLELSRRSVKSVNSFI